MVLPRLDCSFGGISLVDVWQDASVSVRMVAKMTFVRRLLGSWVGMMLSDVARSRLMAILVDWMFCCSMRRCPLLVASDFFKCLVIRVVVRPGQESKWLCRIARRKVEYCGLKAQAWRKAARSCLVLTFLMAPLAECCTCGVSVSFGASGMCQRPLTLLR